MQVELAFYLIGKCWVCGVHYDPKLGSLEATRGQETGRLAGVEKLCGPNRSYTWETPIGHNVTYPQARIHTTLQVELYQRRRPKSIFPITALQPVRNSG
eukprot:sb/3478709/